jgi:hypothetical protein
MNELLLAIDVEVVEAAGVVHGGDHHASGPIGMSSSD